MQADDFFNAYLVLNKTIEVSTHPIMVPTVVCLAFAVELYIKDLYLAINVKTKKTHNILELFEALPENIRHEIVSHESVSKNPSIAMGDPFSVKRYSANYTIYDGFIYHIKAISEGFENWRYVHEEIAPLNYNSWFAVVLIEAIKAVANAVRQRSLKPSP